MSRLIVIKKVGMKCISLESASNGEKRISNDPVAMEEEKKGRRVKLAG